MSAAALRAARSSRGHMEALRESSLSLRGCRRSAPAYPRPRGRARFINRFAARRDTCELAPAPGRPKPRPPAGLLSTPLRLAHRSTDHRGAGSLLCNSATRSRAPLAAMPPAGRCPVTRGSVKQLTDGIRLFQRSPERATTVAYPDTANSLLPKHGVDCIDRIGSTAVVESQIVAAGKLTYGARSNHGSDSCCDKIPTDFICRDGPLAPQQAALLDERDDLGEAVAASSGWSSRTAGRRACAACRRASRRGSAPTCGARSVLLMTNRSLLVMPGPPLRGIFSPAATSIT